MYVLISYGSVILQYIQCFRLSIGQLIIYTLGNSQSLSQDYKIGKDRPKILTQIFWLSSFLLFHFKLFPFSINYFLLSYFPLVTCQPDQVRIGSFLLQDAFQYLIHSNFKHLQNRQMLITSSGERTNKNLIGSFPDLQLKLLSCPVSWMYLLYKAK